LKAGLWVRRTRLAIVAPDPRHSRRSQADFPLIGPSEFGQPPLQHPVIKQIDVALAKAKGRPVRRSETWRPGEPSEGWKSR
jgi:hypothetical protein